MAAMIGCLWQCLMTGLTAMGACYASQYSGYCWASNTLFIYSFCMFLLHMPMAAMIHCLCQQPGGWYHCTWGMQPKAKGMLPGIGNSQIELRYNTPKAHKRNACCGLVVLHPAAGMPLNASEPCLGHLTSNCVPGFPGVIAALQACQHMTAGRCRTSRHYPSLRVMLLL
jgi:hypothetical protein